MVRISKIHDVSLYLICFQVGGSRKHQVPKSEEIQTVNYQFRIMWDQDEDEAWLQELEQDDANAALERLDGEQGTLA